MKIIHFPCLLALLAVWPSTIQKLKAQNTTPFILTQSRPGEIEHLTQNWHLLQDKRGNIWTLTPSGISKYDGNKFQMRSSMTRGLLDPCYTKAFEDHTGRIWFVGIGGKLAFYENERYHSHQYTRDIEKYVSNDKCVSLHVDSSDVLHIGTFRNGYFKILPTGELLNIVNAGNNPSGIYFTRIEGKHFVFGIHSSSNYNYHYPIYSFNSHGNYKEVAQLYQDTLKAKKEQFPRIRFATFTNGDLIISRNHRLAIVGKDSIQVHKTQAPMTGLMVDRDDGIWLSGLKTKGVLHYPNRELSKVNEQCFIPHTTVHHMIEDKERGIWFGTDTSGLLHMPFRRIRRLKSQGLKRWKAKEKLYLIRNAKAILNCDGKPGLFRVYDGKNLYELSVDSDKPISTHYFNKADNTLFLASKTSLIVVKTDSLSEDPELKIELKGSISSIIPKQGGQGVWISAGQGVYNFSKDQIVESLPILPFRIIELCETNSFLYAATANGLWKFDGNSWEDLSDKNDGAKGLISHITWYKNRLWIFSFKHGLTVYHNNRYYAVSDKRGAKFYNIDRSNPTDSALETLNSNGQFLSFIPLGDQEYRIDLRPTPHLFKSFRISLLKTVGDDVIMESQGDVYLYSNKSDFPTPNITSAIDKIEVNGISRPFTNKIELPHDSNTISFHFSVKSYHSERQHDYSYRMSGIDPWTITKQPFLRYNTLPKGQYTFEMYAMNNFFQFTETHKITITILPPYYETWWFRTGIGSLIGLIVFVGFWLRVYRLKRKGALLQELHDSQYQALAARMNPHFLFNSLSAIHDFTLHNPKELSAEYISDYALLMRMVLENSTQNVVSLKTELETISLYIKMENLRCEGRIEYSIDVKSDIDIDHTETPTALLQPYLENAIWHGLAPKKEGPAQLKLTVKKNDDQLLLCVEDNGIGRKASANLETSNHAGFNSQGTEITERRIQLMNTLYGSRIAVQTIDLYQGNSEPAGTLVRITIPMQ